MVLPHETSEFLVHVMIFLFDDFYMRISNI